MFTVALRKLEKHNFNPWYFQTTAELAVAVLSRSAEIVHPKNHNDNDNRCNSGADPYYWNEVFLCV